MKKILKPIFVAVTCMIIPFFVVSCSDDNGDDRDVEPALFFETNMNSLWELKSGIAAGDSEDKKFFLKINSSTNNPISYWRSNLIVENNIESWCLNNEQFGSAQEVEVLTNTPNQFKVKLVYGADHYEEVVISETNDGKKFELKGYTTGYSPYALNFYLTETSENIFSLKQCN